jgi:hypothetical protein
MDSIQLWTYIGVYVFIGCSLTAWWTSKCPWWDRPNFPGYAFAIVFWPVILTLRWLDYFGRLP